MGGERRGGSGGCRQRHLKGCLSREAYGSLARGMLSTLEGPAAGREEEERLPLRRRRNRVTRRGHVAHRDELEAVLGSWRRRLWPAALLRLWPDANRHRAGSDVLGAAERQAPSVVGGGGHPRDVCLRRRPTGRPGRRTEGPGRRDGSPLNQRPGKCQRRISRRPRRLYHARALHKADGRVGAEKLMVDGRSGESATRGGHH